MPDEAIAAAHEQAVEQVMSDERLLGVLPDDLSQTLLDWVIAQFGRAAERAPNVEAFWNEADAIRFQARTLADASADAGDNAAALLARLRSAESSIDEALPTPDAVILPSGSVPTPSPTVQQEVSAPVPVPTTPPAAGSSSAPPSEPIGRPHGSGAMPSQKRPPITRSLRLSWRRTYRRFRGLFGTGGSR